MASWSQKHSAYGTAKVTFTVENSGKPDGDEVAQVYFRHVHSNVPQAKLALCGFTRVQLKRGESNTSRLNLPKRPSLLGHGQQAIRRGSGRLRILIGAASDDLRLKLPLTISAR